MTVLGARIPPVVLLILGAIIGYVIARKQLAAAAAAD